VHRRNRRGNGHNKSDERRDEPVDPALLHSFTRIFYSTGYVKEPMLFARRLNIRARWSRRARRTRRTGQDVRSGSIPSIELRPWHVGFTPSGRIAATPRTVERGPIADTSKLLAVSLRTLISAAPFSAAR
jgi:hypothetical protein